MRYVKPHGALYNAIVHHEEQAEAVVEAVRRYDPTLPVLGPAGLGVARGRRGCRADAPSPRRSPTAPTRPEGTLVSRREPGAVLHDPDEVAERSVRMATHHEVVAVDGSLVAVRAGSVCVHGDSAGAVAMAAAVRRGLEEAGVRVAAFVGGDAG